MRMRSNYFSLMIALLLLAGCAGTSENVVPEVPQQQTGSETEVDMSVAIAALNEGKPVIAEALLRGLAQRHPQAGIPWVNIGLIHFRRGEWDRAQQAAEKALALQSEINVADYLLGLVAHQRRDAPLALKHYQASLAKEQQHANSHYNLALLYDTYYQDLEKALFHYNRYLELIDGEDEATRSWVRELEGQLAPDGDSDES